jgi:acyl carrier protein
MTDSGASPMIESSLKNFIANEIGVRSDLPSIGGDTKLIESGVLDSLSVLKLVIFIEEKFEVKVEADEVVAENFETLDAMTNLVRKKKPGGPSSSQDPNKSG